MLGEQSCNPCHQLVATNLTALGIHIVLESLTEPHRLVFELAVYQELPYAQVGQVLGIPVGTVKSRMHNSVRAIRELLRETEDVAGDPAPRSAGNGGRTG